MTANNISSSVPIKKATYQRQPLFKPLSRSRWAYLFVSPFFILFLIFSLYPILFSLFLSLNEWKGVGPMKYVGLDNFARLLNDQIFWTSMKNGVIMFSLSVPLMTMLALILAVILNSRRVRGFRFFRLVLFMPYITNMAAAGVTFRLLLQQRDGLVNTLLNGVGLPGVPWLESPFGAQVSVALLIIWAWLGYNMVLMLAGLQTISSDLNEAAMIDGADTVRVFLYITIPLMRPMITFSLILSTIGSFGLFTEVFTLTGGGPMNATITPIIDIFSQAFTNLRFGYASAMGYVYFIFIFILTLLQFRYVSRRDSEES